MARKKIIEATRVPTNKHQWWILLSCGHRVMINAKHRPNDKAFRCQQCQDGIPVRVTAG